MFLKILFFFLPLSLAHLCSWHHITQPLSHFNLSESRYFSQRYCIITTPSTTNPRQKKQVIFFYCGNESPVEVYIQNDGFLLETSLEDYDILTIFAEHRFFGKSSPDLHDSSVYQYLSIKETLADYALLLASLPEFNSYAGVIAFGGSYGGMLAPYFRSEYPNIVSGAVSSSGPVFGFPFNHQLKLDSSSALISANFKKYSDQAYSNILATFILSTSIQYHTAEHLLELQNLFFLLSEGNYAFPSSYISDAVYGNKLVWPARPLHVAADMVSKDYNISVEVMNVREVEIRVSVYASDGSIMYQVKTQWDKLVITKQATKQRLEGSTRLFELLSDVDSMYATFNPDTKMRRTSGLKMRPPMWLKKTLPTLDLWNVLVCNDGINLVQSAVVGVGRDMFWPPNVERMAVRRDIIRSQLDFCKEIDINGFNYREKELDYEAKRISDTFHGLDLASKVSNLLFTNGAFDPWSVDGVPQSLVIEDGAHHSDLCFRSVNDSESLLDVRQHILDNVVLWII